MVLILSALAFRFRLRKRDWAAVAAMTVGTICLLYALSPSPGNPPGGERAGLGRGSPARWSRSWPRSRAGSEDGARISSGRLRNRIGGQLLARRRFIAADLVDGVSIARVWRWQTYLGLVAGAAALVLLQLGLQAGPLVAVAPGTTLADPLVAIVLSVALFHEHARTGAWLVPEVLAATAIAWGTRQLSSSPMLAAAPPASTPREQPVGSTAAS